MFQQAVNDLYTYANRATIPPTTLPKPQQDDLEREQIKKISWVQETAYKIALKQKKLLEEPIKDIDRNLLGNLTNDTHWLKAGQPGKLVAAVVCLISLTTSWIIADLTLGVCIQDAWTTSILLRWPRQHGLDLGGVLQGMRLFSFCFHSQLTFAATEIRNSGQEP